MFFPKFQGHPWVGFLRILFKISWKIIVKLQMQIVAVNPSIFISTCRLHIHPLSQILIQKMLYTELMHAYVIRLPQLISEPRAEIWNKCLTKSYQRTDVPVFDLSTKISSDSLSAKLIFVKSVKEGCRTDS